MARTPRIPLSRTTMIVGIALFLLAGGVFADFWSTRPVGIQPTYVGRSSCIECHQAEAKAYAGSHHDLAMDLATDETVLGDFDDATLEFDGMTSRMYRDGDRFMVYTEGEDGEMRDFEIQYVLGVDPLQQYMVEFDRTPEMSLGEIPRVQVLRISWDTAGKRWFYLRPPDVTEKLEADDPLHWTGIAQRWQTMCADCHSTDLKRNFETKSNSYHTTFSEIDVSCESCHGPGSLHVELAKDKSLFWDRRYGYGLAKLKGEDPEPQLQTCAPCHSRRGILDEGFKAGEQYNNHFHLELLQDDTYYADGQIKDEVYVYGSFIQSRMYHKGIRCTDCHDPHSLKLKYPGNQTCTSCHQHAAGKYDVPSHHHHLPGSEGAKCVNCHMPERTYMDVDPRRDHSLRVPRPDLSVSLGTPNACSGCHVQDQVESLDASKRDKLGEYQDWLQAASDGDSEVQEAILKTDQWCDDACEKWYGAARKKPAHFAEAVVDFRRGEAGSVKEMLKVATQTDENVPAIARASALSELGTNGVPDVYKTAAPILKDLEENPIVRAAAIGTYMTAPPNATRKALMPLLQDDSRLVRTEAARVLVASGTFGDRDTSDTDRTRISLAVREVQEAYMSAADRAGSHLGWAMLCEGQGRYDEAIASYETAIRIEPEVAGARSNMAGLLENLAGQSRGGPQAAGLMKRAGELRAAELPLLARDADLAPYNANVQYRYGLALYLAGNLDKAMERLEKAVELDPSVPTFRQARDLLKEKIDGGNAAATP